MGGIIIKYGQLADAIENLWKKVYTNRLTTSLILGAAHGTNKALEVYEHMGEPYLDETSGAKISNVDTSIVLFYATNYFLSGGVLCYGLLTIIKMCGGLRNTARVIGLGVIPKKYRECRKNLIERLCESSTGPIFEQERAIILLKEEDDPLNAMEYVRRAINSTIRTNYKPVRGRAEFRRKAIIDKIMSNDFEKGLIEYLQNLERGFLSALETLRAGDDPAEVKFLEDLFEEKGERLETTFKEYLNYCRVLEHYITSLRKINSGNLEAAESELEKTCNMQPVMTNRCVYGSFLDTVAEVSEDHRERTRAYWKTLIDEFMESPGIEEKFVQIPGTKNSVFEYVDTETTKSLLIIKRSREEEELMREFRITDALFAITGYKGIVPEAITFKERDGHYYFIQKRVQGRTLQEVIQRDGPSQSVLIKLIETLYSYQRAISLSGNTLGVYGERYGFAIPEINYAGEFEEKFFKRIAEQANAAGVSSERMAERMQPVFEWLRQQREGGCHGDLHGRNIIAGPDKIQIIDSEKLFWGPRILDWANFLLHTKVEQGVDLDSYADMGYDVFRKRGMTKDEYRTAYHCATVFQATHLTGTVSKFRRSLDPQTAASRIDGYFGEIDFSLALLAEGIQRRYRQAIEELRADFSRIHQSLSPSHCLLPSVCRG